MNSTHSGKAVQIKELRIQKKMGARRKMTKMALVRMRTQMKATKVKLRKKMRRKETMTKMSSIWTCLISKWTQMLF